MRYAVVLVIAVLAACRSTAIGSGGPPPPPAPPPPLHVQGNQLVDSAGQVVRLRGVNRSGTEYACAQGWGFFDGPSDSASVAAIAAWKVNVVRVPLNETCWLAINGVAPAYSGANYRQAISDFVVSELPYMPFMLTADNIGFRKGVVALDDFAGGAGAGAPYGSYTRNSYLWDVR